MQGNILKEEFKNEVGEWYQTHDSGNCFYRPTQVAYQDLQNTWLTRNLFLFFTVVKLYKVQSALNRFLAKTAVKGNGSFVTTVLFIIYRGGSTKVLAVQENNDDFKLSVP